MRPAEAREIGDAPDSRPVRVVWPRPAQSLQAEGRVRCNAASDDPHCADTGRTGRWQARFAARSARSVRLKSNFQLQYLAESACYLVHYCFRYITGGIAAEQSEHARTAQVSLQAGLTGDDVEVDVLKAFRFGEQRDVGLAAAGHIPQRGTDGSEQRSQISGFTGGQVIQRYGMTARDKHQPAGQRRAERMGDAPSRTEIDPLSCRQICPRIVNTAHAPLISRHAPHCSRTAFPLRPAKSLTAATPPPGRSHPAALRARSAASRSAWLGVQAGLHLSRLAVDQDRLVVAHQEPHGHAAGLRALDAASRLA